jgi:hypothetical protein
MFMVKAGTLVLAVLRLGLQISLTGSKHYCRLNLAPEGVKSSDLNQYLIFTCCWCTDGVKGHNCLSATRNNCVTKIEYSQEPNLKEAAQYYCRCWPSCTAMYTLWPARNGASPFITSYKNHMNNGDYGDVCYDPQSWLLLIGQAIVGISRIATLPLSSALAFRCFAVVELWTAY